MRTPNLKLSSSNHRRQISPSILSCHPHRGSAFRPTHHEPSGDIIMPTNLGGTFTFPGTSLTVHRMGYGAMQLAGPGVWGPPKDHAACLAVLSEAVAAGVNHIATSDFYGPHVTNQIIKEALHPYAKDLVLVTK